MQAIIWDHPVRVGVKGERTINGPQDALQYLSEMPQGGWFYERARNRCPAALERGDEPGQSRKAFIGAAIESSFPVSDETFFPEVDGNLVSRTSHARTAASSVTYGLRPYRRAFTTLAP
ncbi:hypothetical protein N183_23355 [Sinorhizobium sp. Sb3]|uniref:DUF982 domain-containing protein n=1 Tax=Sinorhizobium sp. Sb3 TaxID=1358417 RepID=UPI00071DCA4E|nr:DUF982 domain-containing protein [Sinorhizobium sp. Sb3]KSV74808.1 hypothetical protein N183_23355 [Sinorhizobium sp. Sb3]